MGSARLSSVLVWSLVLGCSPAGELAKRLAKPPNAELGNQTQCKIQKSRAKPLIVEWPAADRALLEAEAQGNVVVVAYDGCEMKLLPHCAAPGAYTYRGVAPKHDTVIIRNEDDLYANMPVYAVKFQGKLASAGQLNVALTTVGHMEASEPWVRRDRLSGLCQGATHVVAGLAVGAFEFYAGAAAQVVAGGSGFGVDAGNRGVAVRETLARDGSPAACRQPGDFGQAPPVGCTALLRVE
ncbi:MAG: hypothetical protein JRI23_10800, partial [Deltaproteobacteria bacterium]|nr:hypothetical protein [Deltaproteobacteria bacterium]MBW2532166.1 hypothetical protein [Deltaproteobacteria bacterium]